MKSVYLAGLLALTAACGRQSDTSSLQQEKKEEKKFVSVKDATIETGKSQEYECSVDNEACKKPATVRFVQNRDTRVEVEDAVLVFEKTVSDKKVTYTVAAGDLNGRYGNDGEKSFRLANINKISATAAGENKAADVDLTDAVLVKVKFKAKTVSAFDGRGKIDLQIQAR